jgi:hypothetical protein
MHLVHILLATNPYNITAQDIGLQGGTANIGTGLGQIASKLMVLLGMLAIIMIMVGAIQMVASAGDTKRFATGRETLLYAVVGLVIAIAAYAIVNLVVKGP